jgi:hypothetical protein
LVRETYRREEAIPEAALPGFAGERRRAGPLLESPTAAAAGPARLKGWRLSRRFPGVVPGGGRIEIEANSVAAYTAWYKRDEMLRAVVWVSAVLLGGLGVVVLIYSLIGGASLASGIVAIGLAVAAVTYMVLVAVRFSRSERVGNSRWYDRERRGF